MATFSQGIQLVSVSEISLTTSSVSASEGFSCPSGHYAKCYYSILVDGQGGNNFARITGAHGLRISVDDETNGRFSGVFGLTSGQSITCNVSNITTPGVGESSISVFIQVYKNP